MAKAVMRWGIERRLEFIEFRLFWEGAINRSDLCERFGVSVPQASADLARYRSAAPDNMAYDSARKEFRAATDFAPVYYRPSAARYLSQLEAATNDGYSRNEVISDWLPSHDVLPALSPGLDAATLRRVVVALHRHGALHIRYRPLTSAELDDCWVSPVALFHDGARWRVRGWCHENADFRDFSLVRIIQVMAQRRSDIRLASDAEWHRMVVFRMGPHPELLPLARRALEIAYGMHDGELEMTVRAVLAPYLFGRLNLSSNPELPPTEDRQLVLLNREEIEDIVLAQRPVPSVEMSWLSSLEKGSAAFSALHHPELGDQVQ